MTGKIADKITLVTGGSSGLGFATAKRFVYEGAEVVITGRRGDELDKAVKELGAGATGVRGDVSNLSDLDQLYSIIREKFGRLEVLFANAGAFVRFGEITEDHFDKYYNINKWLWLVEAHAQTHI